MIDEMDKDGGNEQVYNATLLSNQAMCSSNSFADVKANLLSRLASLIVGE